MIDSRVVIEVLKDWRPSTAHPSRRRLFNSLIRRLRGGDDALTDREFELYSEAVAYVSMNEQGTLERIADVVASLGGTNKDVIEIFKTGGYEE